MIDPVQPSMEGYTSYANDPLSKSDMEAVVANTEQENGDVDQAILHNMYIGWIMGIARTHGVPLLHKGGNQVELELRPTEHDITVTLIIPYPPKDWQP